MIEAATERRARALSLRQGTGLQQTTWAKHTVPARAADSVSSRLLSVRVFVVNGTTDFYEFDLPPLSGQHCGSSSG